MEIVIQYNTCLGVKKVTAANGDNLVYFHPLTIVSNLFMMKGTYPLMLIRRIYNKFLISNLKDFCLNFLKKV